MSGNIGRLLLCIPGALNIAPRPLILRTPTLVWSSAPVLTQGAIRNYAARRGTRERKAKEAKANKAAKRGKEEARAAELKKLALSKLKNVQHKSLFPDESEKEECEDNVTISGTHKWPVYNLKQAINNFKEVHHPTVFDNPKALIKAYLELDLSTKKKTQFLEHVNGVVELPHTFDTGKPIKSVCLFCKDKALNEEALAAGANAAVGVEGVKMFQDGDLDDEDYDVIVAHPDILPDLTPIRGLISKKFPNIKKGTVGFDVVTLVRKFKSGLDYNMTQSSLDPKLGFVQVPIGTADMTLEQMEENFRAVVDVISKHKPAGVSNEFVTLGGLTSQNSNERFKVNMDEFLNKEEDSEGEDSSEESEKKSARA